MPQVMSIALRMSVWTRACLPHACLSRGLADMKPAQQRRSQSRNGNGFVSPLAFSESETPASPFSMMYSPDGGSCILQGLAAEAEGYDAADLEALLDRAVHAALSRKLAAGPAAVSLQPGAAMSHAGQSVAKDCLWCQPHQCKAHAQQVGLETSRGRPVGDQS